MKRNRMVRGRHTATCRPRVEELESRETPAAAWALSGSNLLRFATASPAITQSTPITGITAGETLVGIDFRPQNGLLYGLGVNSTADTGTLYLISTRTGVAGVVGNSGSIAFTTDGVTPIDLPDPATTGYGVDFNPAADRFRVVANGLNFRVNPNSGAPVDGDNGLAAGSVSGTNADGPINSATTTLDATAYTNNQPNNGGITTQYTLDASTNALFIQNPPNSGTQTLVQTLTLGGSTLDFTAIDGFDIPAGVNAAASNAPVTTGSGFAVLNVGGTTGLYTINLVNGQATFIGAVGNGATAVQGLSIQNDLGGFPAIALNAPGTNLVRFNTATPDTPTSAPITGIVAGETLVGIDFRPQTGQLYGLGVNSTANSATLYLIDPQTGAVAAVGTASQIVLVVADGTTVVDLPDPATSGYGFDFNPTVDRLRVTTGTGLNFRVNPITGAPVDGDANAANGINPDTAINGSGVTGVSATAYTNSFGQSLPGAATTQYTLDDASNSLSIQFPPNSGTQTTQVIVTLGGSTLDFTAVNGFDIPGGVRVATSGSAVANGAGFAVLTVGGITGLYSIELSTGAATVRGDVGTGTTAIAGLALGDAPDLVNTPSVTNATTNEDVQTTSGLVISRNAVDGSEVTHFKITSITNGTLFLNDGTTQILNGSFITFAQGNAGLKFTPSANFFGAGGFSVQASSSASDAGLGGSVVTANITVNPVADTPSVTGATTDEDTQTTAGLVISRNAADGSEVTHFKITGITNGTLFLNDGTTPIANGSFITAAQGNAGLKFTPNAGFSGIGSIDVQASLSNSNAGLGGSVITATITVNPVVDTPSVTNATTNEDTQTTSGLVISRNAADGSEVTHFKITGITNGTLFQNDGTTPIATGSFITFAEGNAGLKFTPIANFFGAGGFSVQASSSASDAGLGGSVVTANITVNPVADTPSVTNSTTERNTQTTTGLVISRNPVDGSEVTHFKITGIANGTLFLNDGTTSIADGSFITAAQGNAGLKFTPATNFFGAGHFTIQASTSNLDAGLGGAPVTASITVNPIVDPDVYAIGLSAGGGADGAEASVAVRNSDGTRRFNITPYAGYAGNVTVATGDVNGDGLDDIITGAGAGGAPHVKVFDGIGGAELFSFFAFDSAFTGGVTVAAGDIDGDTFADIIVGAGPGAGPHVKVFSGATGAEIRSFFAYEVRTFFIIAGGNSRFAGNTFTGGVDVAAGDVDNDGDVDIITGTVSGAPHVKVFDGATLALQDSFFSFDLTTNGVNVGVTTRGGRDILIAGAGASATAPPTGTVKFFIDGVSSPPSILSPFPGFPGGVRVAGNTLGRIIAVAGPGGAPHVKVFDGTTLAELDSCFALDPAFRGGVFVG